MITIRPAHERGTANLGWLASSHSFSFGQYYDPQQMGFGHLRVINEDQVMPGQGFGTHGHRDMEIITYVLEGSLEHKDSIGNGSVMRAGDIQRMSAGTGILHSEFNASDTDSVHFLQIWILPEAQGLVPSYEQISVSPAAKQNQLRLVGSQAGHDDSVTIHQDVNLYAAQLTRDASVSHGLRRDRAAWLQVARGSISLNGQSLSAGDGAAITDEATLDITGSTDDAEVLLFDMTVG